MNTEEFRPWLIQRLEAPAKPWKVGGVEIQDNPFSFGGGLVNGGLNKEAMNLLRPIFSFDYMGASEFEWGAVPKSLGKLLEARKAGKLLCGEMTCRGVPVFYVVIDGQLDDVKAFISAAAKEEPRLKEMTFFPRVLDGITGEGDPARNWKPRTLGWLCCDEDRVLPFMWFVDKTMFEGVKQIFELA